MGVRTQVAVRPYGGVSAPDRVAARRERLVDAAVELYGTRGFAGTGVKDICRRAGLTDRYFYESFRNSAALFLAAFDRAAADLLLAVVAAVSQAAAEPEAQARAAVESFVRRLADDHRAARLLFVEVVAAGAEVKHHVRGSTRRFADLIAATARPHLASQEVPEQLLAMASLSIVGAIGSVMIEWLDGEIDASLDEVIEYFVELLRVAAAAGSRAP
jgi:AcrR family transcriptional regulator